MQTLYPKCFGHLNDCEEEIYYNEDGYQVVLTCIHYEDCFKKSLGYS